MAPFEIVRGSTIADACVAVLYQGRAKTRKTTCAATWPNPVVISVDPNRSPWGRFPDAQLIVNPTVQVIEQEIMPAFKQGKIDADTIVYDSWTFLSNKWADRIMGPTATSYGKGQGQAAGVTLRRHLLDLIELKTSKVRPYNIVITVHEGMQGEEGAKRIDPITIGALREFMGAYFDVIVLTEMQNRAIKDPKTQATLRIDTVCVGHTRSPDPSRTAGGSLWGRLLPASIEDPTYQNLRRAAGLPVDFEPKMVEAIEGTSNNNP